MLNLAIVGATGNFGGDIIDALLARGVDPSELLALGRDGDRLQQLADRGLRTASVDLTDAPAMAAALSGVETLLLISVGAPGEGLALRSAAVDAARAGGVRHIFYTSALGAPTTSFVLAAEHKATEDVITAAGIPATFLRIGWYSDNLRQDFEGARARGVIANSVGEGRLATAPRSDMAEAVAVALTAAQEQGTAAYELSGDTAWSFAEFAALAGEALGAPVRYDALTPEQERDMLAGAGLDDATVGFIGVLNAGMRDNTQALRTGDLARLLGRPTPRCSTRCAAGRSHATQPRLRVVIGAHRGRRWLSAEVASASSRLGASGQAVARSATGAAAAGAAVRRIIASTTAATPNATALPTQTRT